MLQPIEEVPALSLSVTGKTAKRKVVRTTRKKSNTASHNASHQAAEEEVKEMPEKRNNINESQNELIREGKDTP